MSKIRYMIVDALGAVQGCGANLAANMPTIMEAYSGCTWFKHDGTLADDLEAIPVPVASLDPSVVYGMSEGLFGPVGAIVVEDGGSVTYVPAEVSRFQARAALLIAGYLPTVEATISAADPLTQLAWADAQVFRRNSPTIAALAAAIGLTESQIDALFVQAAQIEA